MKKIIPGLVLMLASSCEYKDIGPRICFLESEQTATKSNFYTYNSANELVSYRAPDVFSSTLTNDGSGKIISELDNGNIQINYAYDQSNRLVLWTEASAGNTSNLQAKFMYNASGQDTLIQYFNYNVSSGTYDLQVYTRLSYTSPTTKNYSERRTYNDLSVLLYTEKYLWDNHPNPYLANAFFTNEPPPSNNILRHEITYAGGNTTVANLSYDYNSNGFPMSQTETGYGVIAYYTYTNCK